MITAQQNQIHLKLTSDLQDCSSQYHALEIRQKELKKQCWQRLRPLVRAILTMALLAAAAWPFWSRLPLWGGLLFAGLLPLILLNWLPQLAPALNEHLIIWKQEQITDLNALLKTANISVLQNESLPSEPQKLFLRGSFGLVITTLTALSFQNMINWSPLAIAIPVAILYACLLFQNLSGYAACVYDLQTYTDLLQPLDALPQLQYQALSKLHLQAEHRFKLSPQEQKEIQAHHKYLRRQHWITQGYMILLALPLAYMGSMSLAQVTGMGYSYIFGLRTNPILWLVFSLAIFLAELSFKNFFVNRWLSQYSLNQLFNGWRVQERQVKLCYRFRSLDQMLTERRGALFSLAGGVFILVIDIWANYLFLTQQTAAPWHAAILFALLLPVAIILLAKTTAIKQMLLDCSQPLTCMNTEA